jgi:hypothetical protein
MEAMDASSVARTNQDFMVEPLIVAAPYLIVSLPPQMRNMDE